MEQYLVNLPRPVREALGGINNTHIVGNAEVAAAVAALRAGEDRHEAAVRIVKNITLKIEAGELERTNTVSQVAMIDRARPELAGRIIAGEADDAADRAAQARRADIRRRNELLGFGTASLKNELAAASHAVRNAEVTVNEDSMRLEQARFDARVALAYEKAGLR